MARKPKTIDEYIAASAADKRAALATLRRTIKSIAPRAEECISYGLPAFRLDGRMLVAFGAGASHCAFYPMSSTTVAAHARALARYDTSKGTIRFRPEKPLPAALVRKLVEARIAENENASAAKASRSSTRKPARARKAGVRTDPAVTAFLRELDHPLEKDIDAVRKIILACSPTIREGIKWSSPSFRTKDYFATVLLREKTCVQLVFHAGAKVKDNSSRRPKLAAPDGMVKWLANDRCLVKLGSGRTITRQREALASIVRDWIRQL